MFPLRVRSSFSLMRGTSSPRALCRRASTLGYQGLALTDRDNLYGLWEFLDGCREYALRPIVGAELSEPDTGRIVTCLVKNDLGFRHLCLLLSDRHEDSGFRLASGLAQYAEGLLVLSREKTLLDECLRAGVDAVADLGAHPSASGRDLRSWAKAMGLLAVATPDSDMATAEEKELRCLLRAIRHGETISEARAAQRTCVADWLAEPHEYRQRFAIWPEAVTQTEILAERCSFTGPQYGIVMPPWQKSDAAEADFVLRRVAYSGARSRYGADLGEAVVERLEYELKIICDMGFASYFLVVRDIVHPKDDAGNRHHRRICGRGSGAASLVAYCLQITNVCPIRYNLYFERFLHPERRDPPDIDIDFAWDERDEVLQQVLSDYSGHAAMVCNHVFFQPRMAIRETAKTFGLPAAEISLLTKRIPWTLPRKSSSDLVSHLSALPSLKDMELAEPWPEILGLAWQLIGLPRYLSVHPGGVVITPRPIREYVPVERATKGVPIIQWEKDGTEEAGLVKIDLLGNRSLAVIRDCIAALRERNEAPDELSWQPEDDPATKLLVARGSTMGCFYIESPAMRLLEQKAGTGDFEQLVIQSSIIRPAANEFVREYVRRLHGGTWTPLCPEMDDVLDETMGLMVYQEDVSRVAVALAGFSHSEADGLRRILSKKDRLRRLESYRSRFFAGCVSQGVATEVVEEVWRMMMSFDGYSFCKPHSASYARVSFQAAFLKRHAPAEFMAAVIANGGGYYSTFAYVSEAKRLGLHLEPPDVNRAEPHWTGNGNGNGNGNKKTVRVGLQAVKGLSDDFVKRIVRQRRRRRFRDLEDFFARTEPADDEIRALIHAGGLDEFEPCGNRTVLLWQWACWQRLTKESRRLSLLPVVLPPPPPLPSADPLTLARREYGVLGFLCKAHPLAFCRTTSGDVHASELASCRGRRVRLRAWLLSGKLISTKTGEAMEFLTFEDETAVVEATFFPEVYRRYAHILRSGRGYLLEGMVEEDFGALTLTVERLQSLT